MSKRQYIGNIDFQDSRSRRQRDNVIIEQRLNVLRLNDRDFMKMCVHYGMSVSMIARVTRFDRKYVTARLTRIKKLLLNRNFLLSQVNRQQLTLTESQATYDHLINNLGYRRLAQKYKLNIYQARKLVSKCLRIANSK